MRLLRVALVAFVAMNCRSLVTFGADGPVWPPVSAAAPAEVAWQGMIEDFRPKGLGRIFRAVAGAGRQQQSLPMALEGVNGVPAMSTVSELLTLSLGSTPGRVIVTPSQS